jgi:hypothetical protein
MVSTYRAAFSFGSLWSFGAFLVLVGSFLVFGTTMRLFEFCFFGGSRLVVEVEVEAEGPAEFPDVSEVVAVAVARG